MGLGNRGNTKGLELVLSYYIRMTKVEMGMKGNMGYGVSE